MEQSERERVTLFLGTYKASSRWKHHNKELFLDNLVLIVIRLDVIDLWSQNTKGSLQNNKNGIFNDIDQTVLTPSLMTFQSTFQVLSNCSGLQGNISLVKSDIFSFSFFTSKASLIRLSLTWVLHCSYRKQCDCFRWLLIYGYSWHLQKIFEECSFWLKTIRPSGSVTDNGEAEDIAVTDLNLQLLILQILNWKSTLSYPWRFQNNLFWQWR